MNKVYCAILLLFTTQFTVAQYQIGLIPRESPDKAAYQKIGYTEVEVRYGSPAVKGRKIWGGIVPYSKVWRAGANNATTIEISDNITINNLQLDSGKYAIFIIPKENDEWTVIFNYVHKQWGAFKYDESEDVIRINVSPQKTLKQTENLSYSIYQSGYQYGSIVLNWDSIKLEIPFETDYLKKFEQKVNERAKLQPQYIKWIVYLQGADHLVQIGSKPKLALSWINQAENIMNATSEWNDQFYPRDYIKGDLYWTKAKLLARENNFSSALEYIGKLKKLENTTFFDQNNISEGIDTSFQLWNEKLKH